MKNSMEKTLEKLFAIFTEYNRPVVHLFQDGIDLTYKFKEKKLKYIPSRELLDLYNWKNGTKLLEGYSYNDMDFFPGFYFLSLESSLKAAQSTNKGITFLKPFIKNRKIWKPSFFPIFSNLDNSYLIIDLDNQSSPVYFFSEEIIQDQNSLPMYYSSISNLISTILKCYQDKIYNIAESGIVISNITKEAEVTHALNPNSMFNII